MKKLDRLLILSFIPPFLVTFGIATFVLLMQILWVYIDDIAGKGLGMFVIIELLAYKCVGLVPMALPLAILISGVMVMGGLAEEYQLSAMKSAGVSLLRVMRSIVIFGVFAMFGSYLCNDYIIPIANLQFGSRMYDIREKKPTMSLETGAFNDDFGNYAIRIGEKGKDGRSIKDILIYDHTDANSGKLKQVMAESGQMYSTADGAYFIMQLYNGHQYVETKPSGRSTNKGTPFIRTSFKSWNKVFDLGEFNMSKTNPDLFSMNRSMMTISQLEDRIDTIQYRIDERHFDLAEEVGSQFLVVEVDSIYPDYLRNSTFIKEKARTKEKEKSKDVVSPVKGNRPVTDTPKKDDNDEETAVAGVNVPVIPQGIGIAPQKRDKFPIERFIDSLQSVEGWLNSLSNIESRRFLTTAKSSTRALINQAEQTEVSLDRTLEDKVKHIYEMHTKYSMAVVCIIFVFIGAPLGAIVRKGGFGYPLLVSVVAFIVFIVLTIFCRKIAETFIVPAALAAWLPCIVLAPIGYWLTVTAMADRKLLDLSKPKGWVRQLQERWKKTK